MNTVEITLHLPAEFVQDAAEFGLVSENDLVEALQHELDNRIMTFVNREIHAYRAEKAAQEDIDENEV